MRGADIDKLINSHKLISDQIDRQSLKVVLENLDKVISEEVDGDIVELGCYKGTTSLFIERLLDGAGRFHVYDSFEGLPNKSRRDESSVGEEFKAGELKVSKKNLIREFYKANLRIPVIHKAWFKDLRGEDLPDKIAFAFLDGDFYESIIMSLKLTWPRLSKGGIICVDDYKREDLPGVEKALIDYFGSDEGITKKANIGIVRKS